MGTVTLEHIFAGIDRQLDYLHKQRWAERAAELREIFASSQAKESAQHALYDHYRLEFKPETSRDALRKDAAANFDAWRALGRNISPGPSVDEPSPTSESNRTE